jgi:hypothetical protein
MKRFFTTLLFGILLLVASFDSEAQTKRVYSLDYLLSQGDTSIVIPAVQFDESTNGLVVQALFYKCASQDNASKVDLYNGADLIDNDVDATSVDLDSLGNPILVDSLDYATADGANEFVFYKGDFYKSDLQIRIDAAATATDTSAVKVKIWALTEQK